MAELPDAAQQTPNGTLHFLGGHRLWYAPEVLETTYWPDDERLTVEQTSNGASFTGRPDGQGIVKRMAITVSADQPQIKVSHALTNSGSAAVRLAPWALSMTRPGGVAILPQPRDRPGHADRNGQRHKQEHWHDRSHNVRGTMWSMHRRRLHRGYERR